MIIISIIYYYNMSYFKKEHARMHVPPVTMHAKSKHSPNSKSSEPIIKLIKYILLNKKNFKNIFY